MRGFVVRRTDTWQLQASAYPGDVTERAIEIEIFCEAQSGRLKGKVVGRLLSASKRQNSPSHSPSPSPSTWKTFERRLQRRPDILQL